MDRPGQQDLRERVDLLERSAPKEQPDLRAVLDLTEPLVHRAPGVQRGPLVSRVQLGPREQPALWDSQARQVRGVSGGGGWSVGPPGEGCV